MKLKKVMAVMLSLVMLVYTASDIAYAADSDLQDRNTEVTVNTDGVTAEVDEEPVDGSSDGIKYIYDLAVDASDFPYSRNQKPMVADSSGFKYINESSSDIPADINGQSYVFEAFHTGKFIYLGCKGTSTLESDKKYITGVLLYTCYDGKILDSIEYNGKTYVPVLNRYEDSNLDLNQGSGKEYIYLYYTTDGYNTGDSILTNKTNIVISSSREYSEKYVPDYDNPGISQDMNETFGDGHYVYLQPDYHKHQMDEITPIDGDSHSWGKCKCGYRTLVGEHTLRYEPDTDEGCMHKIACKSSLCSYEEKEYHIDENNDNECDLCGAHIVAKADGYLFSSFKTAWAYAIKAGSYEKISILETVDADKDGELPALNVNRKITITDASPSGDAVLKTYGAQPFRVTNGTLIIDMDITNESDHLDSVIYASGENAEIDLESGSIKYTGNRVCDNGAIIHADQGAIIKFKSKEYYDIQGAGLVEYGILAKGSSTELWLNNLNITGTDNAVVADESENVTISGGTYDGNMHALRLMNNSKAQISGGIFTSDISALKATNGADLKVTGGTFRSPEPSIEVKAGSVKDMLPVEYCFVQEKTGSPLCIENGCSSIADNVIAAKHEDHTGYWKDGFCEVCGHECKHIFDAASITENGVCGICGKAFPVWVESDDGTISCFNTVKEALTKAKSVPESTVTLYSDMRERYVIIEDDENRSKIHVNLNGHTLTFEKNDRSDSNNAFENLDISFENGVLKQIVNDAEYTEELSFSLDNAEFTLGKDCVLRSIGGSLVAKNSSIIISDNAKFYDFYGCVDVENNSALEIRDDAFLQVNKGINIESGSRIKAGGNATIESEDSVVIDGGRLVISGNAKLNGKNGLINLKNKGALEAGENAFIQIKSEITATEGCSIRASGKVWMESTTLDSPFSKDIPAGVITLSGGSYKGLCSDAGLESMLDGEYWAYDKHRPLTKAECSETSYDNVLDVKHVAHDRHFVSGVCSICGYECGHPFVNDGYCTECGMKMEDKSQVEDIKKSIKGAKVSGIVNKTYSGKKRIQTPEIILGGKTLVKGTDYTLSYKNNLNVGKASVTIKGIGAYEGSITKNFKINPKGTYIKKLTGSKKAVTVRWNEQSLKMSKGRITGYQIQYSTSKKMTNAKKKTVKGYSNTSKKISKLKANKRYYVRVRTYKVVSGHYYYSGWSKVKYVKTK